MPPLTPQPTQSAWDMGTMPVMVQLPDGTQRQETHCVLLLHTPHGSNYYFLSPADARRMAENLERTAGQAETGIVIAQQLPPTNGKGPPGRGLITP